jgi:DNA polymerase-3 subunit gamma/tau
MTLAPVAADGSEGRHLPTTSLLSMLGRMDQTQVLGWVKQILSGDPVGAIEQLRIFYAHGSDPTVLLSLLLQWLHRLALATLDRSLLTGLDAASQDTVMEWSQSLDMPSVTRMWQIGLQGLEEISAAPSAIEALEMIVLRMIYMQRLPVPLELLKWAAGNASGGGTHGPSLGRGSAPSKPSHTMASAQALTPANTETSEKIAPLLVLRSASEVVNACLIHDAMLLHYWLYHDIIITSCTEGVLRWTAIDPEAGAHNASMAQKLRQWLNAKTGRVWDVQQEAAPLATLPPSLAAKKQAREEQEETAWRHHPLVQHSYSLFPNARWVGLEMSQDAIEPWLVTHSEPSVDSMLN